MSGRDTAARSLAVAVRLLPPPQREWGEAMLAELHALGSRGDRWRFAAGCMMAIAGRPAVWSRAGSVALPVAIVAAVTWWSAWISWAPRRWGVIAFAAVLAVVAELGVIGPLGPVDRGRAARAARAIAYLLVGTFAVTMAHAIAHKTNNDLTGIPVFSLTLAACLAGALAMTARNAHTTSFPLIAGLFGGTAAAGAWMATALAFPPIPPDPRLAAALMACGMAGSGLLTHAHTRARGGPWPAWRAALTAGTTGALLILDLVASLSAWGPAKLIPHLMPASLTPAAQTSESRIELIDPYLWLLLLGLFLALTQWAISRSGPTAPSTIPDPRTQPLTVR